MIIDCNSDAALSDRLRQNDVETSIMLLQQITWSTRKKMET